MLRLWLSKIREAKGAKFRLRLFWATKPAKKKRKKKKISLH